MISFDSPSRSRARTRAWDRSSEDSAPAAATSCETPSGVAVGYTLTHENRAPEWDLSRAVALPPRLSHVFISRENRERGLGTGLVDWWRRRRAAMRVFRRRFSERPRRARVAPRRVFDGDDAVGTRRVECTLPSPVRRADVVETRERSRRVEDEEKEKMNRQFYFDADSMYLAAVSASAMYRPARLDASPSYAPTISARARSGIFIDASTSALVTPRPSNRSMSARRDAVSNTSRVSTPLSYSSHATRDEFLSNRRHDVVRRRNFPTRLLYFDRQFVRS